jgi:hypothetical protein
MAGSPGLLGRAVRFREHTTETTETTEPRRAGNSVASVVSVATSPTSQNGPECVRCRQVNDDRYGPSGSPVCPWCRLEPDRDVIATTITKGTM